MKYFLYLVISGVLLLGCQKKQDTLAAASIHASSMICGSCAKTVENALSHVEGVKEVNVDLKTKLVQVKYVAERTNLESLEKAITNAGYDANDRKRNPDAYEKLDKCCKIDG
ncbi:MAG: heavy-metal-associated domain-containing protein [Ignavibacteriae bacterium]|nr:heavy-metal-associated domain-containing protein [Ignavibacteriota bacterium]